MKNITLSLNEDILNAGRSYAKKHNISFNALIRRLLEQTVVKSSTPWIEESFELMDKAKVSSSGRKWTKKELYRV